jgi:UDP:flavonoid glycosyltransferase YjiC (YdhE family)
MRIVLAPEGSRGDVQPLVALGQALAARGCEVALAAPPEARPDAEARGLEFHATGPGLRAFLEANAGAVHAGARAIQQAGVRYMRETFADQVAALRAAARGADLVVGAGIQLAAGSVAAEAGAAYRFAAYTPVLFPSADWAPFLWEGHADRRRRWNRLVWRAFIPLYSAFLRRVLAPLLAPVGLPPVRDVYRHLIGDRPLLACDPEIAPLPADCEIGAEPVGYPHPEPLGDLPPKLEDFLAGGSAPVYFGFGSMPDPHPERTTCELLDAVTGLGLRAIVSRGWAGLGRIALPEGVMVVDELPHARLFPRCAAVVHHGGAGTTATAARAGVPQVVVPHLLDQFYFGRRVSALGLGPPPLPRRRLDAASLSSLLEATVDNEAVEDRARSLGDRLRRRDAAGDAADRLLAGLRGR